MTPRFHLPPRPESFAIDKLLVSTYISPPADNHTTPELRLLILQFLLAVPIGFHWLMRAPAYRPRDDPDNISAIRYIIFEKHVSNLGLQIYIAQLRRIERPLTISNSFPQLIDLIGQVSHRRSESLILNSRDTLLLYLALKTSMATSLYPAMTRGEHYSESRLGESRRTISNTCCVTSQSTENVRTRSVAVALPTRWARAVPRP